MAEGRVGWKPQEEIAKVLARVVPAFGTESSLPTPPPAPEAHEPLPYTVEYTVTQDGWRLGLKHYEPPARRLRSVPVIMCHGLACNDYAFEARGKESMAMFVRSCGYDVWLMNLRGAGLSSVPPAGSTARVSWGLREYLEQDAKAAIEYVCRFHGASQVHFIGHSMGGIIGLCLTTMPSIAPRLRSVVTLASALTYKDSVWRYLEPFSGLFIQTHVDMPALANVYSFCSQIVPPDYVAHGPNIAPADLAKMFKHGFERVPTQVLVDLRSSFDDVGFNVFFDGSTEPVSARITRSMTPILMLAPDKDPQCTLESAMWTFEKMIAAPKRLIAIGKRDNCANHYGHFDIILGTNAQMEVHPHVLAWMQEIDDGTTNEAVDIVMGTECWEEALSSRGAQLVEHTSRPARCRRQQNDDGSSNGSNSSNDATRPFHVSEHLRLGPEIDNSGILNDVKKPRRGTEYGRRVWRFCDVNKRELKSDLWEQCDAEQAAKEVGGGVHGFKGQGVVFPEKEQDLKLLVDQYTAPALAAGLRDREETLQLCARLLADNDLEELKKVLHPYQESIIERRRRKTRSLDLAGGLTQRHLNLLRKYLLRAPRQLHRAVPMRASVVIPLCNVDGVASILFEKRSSLVRSFKNQVCFPGGLVEETTDTSIIDTSLREMEEEIGFPAKDVDVLGVLRCDWSEVARHTGIGVTPVVCFLGELRQVQLQPNPDEVSECFTIPIQELVNMRYWMYDEKKDTTVFFGGPHVIWGLSAYILERFLKETVMRYKVDSSQVASEVSEQAE